MKTSLKWSALLVALLATGCKSTTSYYSHWSTKSLGPRISYQFAGYDPTKDGDYVDVLSRDGQSVGLTLQRHLLCNDPKNPLESD